MAIIAYYDKQHSDRLVLCIDELDSTYLRDDRTCTWYLSDGSGFVNRGSQSIAGGVTRSNSFTISGLPPGTVYDCKAEISFSSNPGYIVPVPASGSMAVFTSIWTGRDIMYHDLGIYPTRHDNDRGLNGLCRVFYTWNNAYPSSQMPGKSITIDAIKVCFSKSVSPSEVESHLKTYWSRYECPFDISDMIEYDVASYMGKSSLLETNGELCEIQPPGEDYTCFCYMLWTWFGRSPSGGDISEFVVQYRIVKNTRTYSNLITSTPPTVSCNESTGQITITPYCTGRKVLEFRRSNGSSLYEEYRNELLLTALIDLENEDGSGYGYGGYYSLPTVNPVAERWAVGNYPVDVYILDQGNLQTMKGAVSNAISEVNRIMSEFGIVLSYDEFESIHFVSTIPASFTTAISIVIGTSWQLFQQDEHSPYINGGKWDTNTDGTGKITSAVVKLSNNFTNFAMYSRYETVALEELFQCMGAGFDQLEYPLNTIHTQFNYYNKSYTLYDKDIAMLRYLYSSSVHTGDSYYKVCRELDIPHGCYVPSTADDTTALSFSINGILEPNTDYKIRSFIVREDGTVSATSAWSTIHTPTLPPLERWEWISAIAQNSVIGLTAHEWIEFFARINEFRAYKGLQEYGDYKDSTAQSLGYWPIVPGTKLYAGLVNHAVQAIADLYSDTTTKNAVLNLKKSPGNPITAQFFLDLRDYLNNSVPGL